DKLGAVGQRQPDPLRGHDGQRGRRRGHRRVRVPDVLPVELQHPLGLPGAHPPELERDHSACSSPVPSRSDPAAPPSDEPPSDEPPEGASSEGAASGGRMPSATAQRRSSSAAASLPMTPRSRRRSSRKRYALPTRGPGLMPRISWISLPSISGRIAASSSSFSSRSMRRSRSS